MTNPQITEAAVEAAARAIHETGGFYRWEDPEGWREKAATHEARAALEAAARHMLASAWDEGFDRGFYDPLAGSTRDASESAASNPYA